ncbi:MAG: SufD family Fe-S cluster assembly protein, partial [Actinomycetota bacterium]|nr:SufD family Fe-S cluster assembly protein [Actinomycetota bacterium]
MPTSELTLPTFKGRPGWEFTDISALDPSRFAEATAPAEGGWTVSVEQPILETPEGATQLSQVDGAFSEGVAVEDGPVVLPLSVALERHPELVEPHLGTVVADDTDGFTQANAQSWKGGAFVFVPRGISVEQSIVLTAVSSADHTVLHRRVLVVLEEGAEAEVWEQYLSGDAESETMVNTTVELVVGQNARLRYVCAQDLNERSWIFGSQRAEVARDGALDWIALGFGSARGRVRMETMLAGEGSEGKVTGAYAPHARRHVDFDTTQEHAAPNTTSDLA